MCRHSSLFTSLTSTEVLEVTMVEVSTASNPVLALNHDIPDLQPRSSNPPPQCDRASSPLRRVCFVNQAELRPCLNVAAPFSQRPRPRRRGDLVRDTRLLSAVSQIANVSKASTRTTTLAVAGYATTSSSRNCDAFSSTLTRSAQRSWQSPERSLSPTAPRTRAA